MGKNMKVEMLTEGGVMVALASILSLIKIYEAPFGGSVTAGSMIPIIIFALRWGVMPGIFVGLVYGIIQSILGLYFVHPIQYLLDYPIAFGLLGLAGISKSLSNKIQNEYLNLFIGVFMAIFGRFISHLLSGVVFFSNYALQKGMNPWVYSAVYNGSYLGIELIISLVLVFLLNKPIQRLRNN
ncbi:energy-coupled thiamine transporter ThiT [Caloranaerobacter azorensis]|uniref:Thiamine transporter n=3 Tax=Caloranaerobacter azorensis TaxID=116090 RepID=A0A1M5RR39_9FIRM|nr:energy-coupled thiamine transporter ThiT [Caloranaerobacter azorensis]KGG81123.1 proton-coupled thiamine transporter YuaJ [Caloranaerobacter azorensis H53214]QIB26250.1 energy-coupled thiamine transporter ThiT [Caloranaerobacter azorensis]SHH28659.1 thiamine transporter [Caloranaerobacter azorensis DSM 13643]